MNKENKTIAAPSSHLLTCLLAVFSLLGMPGAFALTWDPGQDGSGTGGTGTWNATNANWWNGTSDVAWTQGVAEINDPAGMITIDTDTVGITRMDMESGGYTIDSANGGKLRTEGNSTAHINILGGSDDTTINAGIDLNGTDTIGGNNYTSFQNAGTGTVFLNGNLISVEENRGVYFRRGNWSLGGENNITGHFRIQAGAASAPVSVTLESPDAIAGISSLSVTGFNSSAYGTIRFDGNTSYEVSSASITNYARIEGDSDITFSGISSSSNGNTMVFANAGTLTVNSTNWSFGGSGATGNYFLNISISADTHLINNANLQGRGAGTGGSLNLQLSGSGTVDMLGASTYDNDITSTTTLIGVTVNANDLDGSNGASSFGTNTSSLNMQNSATLNYVGATGVMNRGIAVSGSGGTPVYTANLNVVNSGVTLNVEGAVTGNTGSPLTLNLGGAGNVVFEGDVGTNAHAVNTRFIINKEGNGTATIATGAQAFTRSVTITGGRFDVDGSLTASNNSVVTVAAGGILGGEGVITTAGTTGRIDLAGTLSPGTDGVATLNVTTLTWLDGGVFEFHLGAGPDQRFA